jgi:nucleoside-diphosphate-sugar epimerase
MILITGASGFVGTHLVHALIRTHEIKCLLRKNSSSSLPDCEIVYGDLLDYESLLQATKGIDTIVHLAADISSTDYSKMDQVNVGGMENLVSASRENKVRKFIFISSAAVTASKDPYSICKKKAETILIGSGLESIILRPAEIYGEGDNKGITKLTNLIRTLPAIPVFGNGEYTLQPIYVKDVVSAIMKFIDFQFEGCRIYNIAGPSVLAFNTVIDIIAECLGVKRIKIHIPISLIRLVVRFQEKILPRPLVSSDQILRITTPGKQWDIHETVRDIGFQPLSFREGIKKTISKIK